MRTPREVALWRIQVIKNMLAGKISMAAAIDIQQLTDREIKRLIRRERNEV